MAIVSFIKPRRQLLRESYQANGYWAEQEVDNHVVLRRIHAVTRASNSHYLTARPKLCTVSLNIKTHPLFVLLTLSMIFMFCTLIPSWLNVYSIGAFSVAGKPIERFLLTVKFLKLNNLLLSLFEIRAQLSALSGENSLSQVKNSLDHSSMNLQCQVLLGAYHTV